MRRRGIKRGRTPAMIPSVNVDEWLAEHPDFMINCPNQPGNLRLSAAACAKRYQTANEPRWANIGAEPFPIFVFKMNLIPCRKCPTGAKMAASHKDAAA